MNKYRFSGDKKVGANLLAGFERFLIDLYVPRIPKNIETYHLTLLTLVWSLGIIVFCYLAHNDIHWLWGMSFMIVLQYITDLFDGALGRYRKTGLVKWGYYMDHFLDYIFLCSILVGYSFLVNEYFKYLLFFTMTIFGAYMVNAFLLFAVTNEFRISYLGIGPTEIRFLFVIINTLLVIFGKTFMGGLLPFVLGFSLIGLFWVVYRTQQYIWEIDMREKKEEEEQEKLPLPPSFITFMYYLRNKIRRIAYKPRRHTT